MASVALVPNAPATPPATDVAIIEAAVDDPMIAAVAAVAAAAFEAAAAIPATIPEIAIPNNPPLMEVSCFFLFFFVTECTIFELFNISTKEGQESIRK